MEPLMRIWAVYVLWLYNYLYTDFETLILAWYCLRWLASERIQAITEAENRRPCDLSCDLIEKVQRLPNDSVYQNLPRPYKLAVMSNECLYACSVWLACVVASAVYDFTQSGFVLFPVVMQIYKHASMWI